MTKILKFINKENAMHHIRNFEKVFPDKAVHYEYHPKSKRPHWIVRELLDSERK